MQYNANPISVREGHIYIDGIECGDGVAFSVKFTPDVWTGKQLNDRTPSSRWLGGAWTGSITRRRTNNWLKQKIKEYQETGATPEITLQGIADDRNSAYYAAHGTDTVTAVGCVLTGDLTLQSLDSNGDVLDDVIAFNAKDVM